jgi:chemotaxis signal transduction protein
MVTMDTESKSIAPEDPQRRELLVIQSREHLLGIFTEHVAGIANGKVPAPLPRAPASVLGVIAFRGRMLTVIDPLLLMGRSGIAGPPSIIVALSGEEQVALTADSSCGAIQISAADIEGVDEDRAGIISGTLRREAELIEIIDVSRLFGATMQQRERRRRRF